MTLTRVTITGADESVSPIALSRLSDEFPFVEWGILFSRSRSGTPRYPGVEWVKDLTKEATEIVHMALSAHACGAHSREIMKGCVDWIDGIHHTFSRVQINGFVPYDATGVVSVSARHPFIEFILQARNDVDLAATVRVVARMQRSSALFDPSGGRGVEAAQWPHAPAGMKVGYAGGIKPSNVVNVIRRILNISDAPTWIDMESGVRTDDKFDLRLVREVLTLARPFIYGGLK